MGELLVVENIVKRFGGLTATNDVSFSVGKEEIVGLIGPNGAGKTTIFNCLSGMLPIDSGKVIFAGDEISRIKAPHQICMRGLCRTFQIVRPFGKLSVVDNVVVAACLRATNINDAYKQADKVLDYVGLAKARNQQAHSLTVSDRKRLELARALATKPTMLLLDEVMAGLNPTELEKMITLIKSIAGDGTAILIIEHIMHAIMNISNRIIVIKQGCKIAEGTPSQVSSDPQVIDAYLGEEWNLA